jgi:hypothetical protein
MLAPKRALALAAEVGKVKFWAHSASAGCLLYLYGASGSTYYYNRRRTRHAESRARRPRRADRVARLAGSLAADEARLAFLREGRHALVRVLAREERAELVGLALEVVDVVALERVVQRALGRRQGPR